MKNFDFDNNTSEYIFSHPYISYVHGDIILRVVLKDSIISPCYMANERLQGEERFHSKNYLLGMPLSHAKIRLKSALQKLNFVMAKAISKSYNLDCSCKCPSTFLHSYA